MITVTAPMIRAGVQAMIGFQDDYETRASLVETIYMAMVEAQQVSCQGSNRLAEASKQDED